MPQTELHQTHADFDKAHADLVNRLKRAEGHLRNVIDMMEAGKSYADLF